MGTFIESSKKLWLDIFTDAYFGSIFEVGHDQEPSCVKSRTCYLVEFIIYCHILWISKLQTQVDLSTMKVVYISSFRSRKDQFAIRGVIQEIRDLVFVRKQEKANMNIHC